MQKLGLVVKNYTANRIKESFKESSALLVIAYSGLSSPDLSTLRLSLNGNNSELLVVRNNVARRALKDAGLEEMNKYIEGPCGLVFVKGEPVAASKLVCDFIKDHEPLKIVGGYIDSKVFEKKDIEILAKLPGKDVLRAQVVCALNAPLVKLVMVLNANLKNVVSCLDQVKQKKEKTN